MTAILRILFDALFGAVIAGIRTWQMDKNLEKLGYTEAQRDAATDHVKAGAVAAAARAAVSDDHSLVFNDSDNRSRPRDPV